MIANTDFLAVNGKLRTSFVFLNQSLRELSKSACRGDKKKQMAVDALFQRLSVFFQFGVGVIGPFQPAEIDDVFRRKRPKIVFYVIACRYVGFLFVAYRVGFSVPLYAGESVAVFAFGGLVGSFADFGFCQFLYGFHYDLFCL